jgi:hypothetical protein
MNGVSLAKLSHKCRLVIREQLDKPHVGLFEDDEVEPADSNWPLSLVGCDIHALDVIVHNEIEADVICRKLPTLRQLEIKLNIPASFLNWPSFNTLESLRICGYPITCAPKFPRQLRKLAFVNGMANPCRELSHLTQLEELTIHNSSHVKTSPESVTMDLSRIPTAWLVRLEINGSLIHRETGRLTNRSSVTHVESLGPSMRDLTLKGVAVESWNWSKIVSRVPYLRVFKLDDTKGIDFSNPSAVTKLVYLSRISWKSDGVSRVSFQKHIDPKKHLPRLVSLTLIDQPWDFMESWSSRDVVCKFG